jgi:hypothetical protein
MSKGVAVLAMVAVLVVGACGDDDTDETGTDGDTTGATDQGDSDDTSGGSEEPGGSDESSEPDAPAGDGYTDQVRSNFLSACVAQPGATEADCECVFDEISAAVPVEDFTAYDQALRQDPATPAPSWLATAVTACS